MSWRVSYELTQAEIGKLCGLEREAADLAGVDLLSDFYEACVELVPSNITVECSECGVRAELETIGDVTRVKSLECDCPPVVEHTEADDWDDAARWKEASGW